MPPRQSEPDLIVNLREPNADVGFLVQDAATGPDPTSALLSVVIARGLPNDTRIAALEAVAPFLSRVDVAEVARAAGKQHEDVAVRAVDVLGQLGGAEAAFALRRVFGRRDDKAARAALQTADAVEQELGPDLAGRDELFRLLGKLPLALTSERLRPDVVTELHALDAGLQEAGRTTAGLNDYQRVLRDDLHSLVLLTDSELDESVRARALDTPLRGFDDVWLRTTLEVVPAAVTVELARRALGRSRRRAKDENARQAEIALEILTRRRDCLREVRADVIDCLSDDKPELVTRALVALSGEHESLDAGERRAVVGRYAELGQPARRLVAASLSGWVSEVRSQGDIALFAEWVSAATLDDAWERFGEALKLWSESSLVPVAARDLLLATEAALEQLDESVRADAELELAKAVVVWLMTDPHTSDALVGAPLFDRIAERHLTDVFLVELPRERAAALAIALIDRSKDPSNLLRGVLDAIDEPTPGAIADLTAADYAEAWSDIGKLASSTQLRRLLLARIAALRRTVLALDDLAMARAEASTEALTSRRSLVLSALADAEQASTGNAAILDQLRVISEAVGGLSGESVSSEPSEAVAQWRADAAQRWDFVTTDPAGLEFTGSDGQLRDVVNELDRRVHARGVVPTSDRPHYRSDLERAVRALVRSPAGPDGADWTATAPMLRGRVELSMLLWHTWGRHVVDDPPGELARRLAGAELDRDAAPAVDSLVRVADGGALRGSVDLLAAETLGSAFALLGGLLGQALRAQAALRSQLAREEGNAARRIADQLHRPFLALEGVVYGYFRLRAVLDDAGWRQIFSSLGDSIGYEDLDPSRHEVRGNEHAERYVVRSLGIEVEGQPVVRAVVEGRDAQ